MKKTFCFQISLGASSIESNQSMVVVGSTSRTYYLSDCVGNSTSSIPWTFDMKGMLDTGCPLWSHRENPHNLELASFFLLLENQRYMSVGRVPTSTSVSPAIILVARHH